MVEVENFVVEDIFFDGAFVELVDCFLRASGGRITGALGICASIKVKVNRESKIKVKVKSEK